MSNIHQDAGRVQAGPVRASQGPGFQHVKLYAKPAAEVLGVLARVRERRAVAMRTSGRFTGSVHLDSPSPVVRGSQGGGASTPLVSRSDSTALSLDLQMTGAMFGHFMLENTAGRTLLAKQIINFVKAEGNRHGLDGFLLTALLHLEATHDAGFADALAVWRNTVGTAGSVEGGDSGVVFDPARQGFASVDTKVFKEPFAGGLCLPTSVQHMQQLSGRDVGIIALGSIVVLGLLGGVQGAVDAVKSGGSIGDVIWGAIGGAFNAIAGALGFGSVLGFATQDSKGDNTGIVNVHSGDGGSGPIVVLNPNPDRGSDLKQVEKTPDNDGSSSTKQVDNSKGSTDVSNKPSDGQGAGGDHPEDTAVPPPNPNGFPAPDDDGGSPWALVGVGPLLPMSSARALVVSNTAPVFAVAGLPGLTVLHQSLDARESAVSQLGRLSALVTTNPMRAASIKQALLSMNTQISTNIYMAPVVARQLKAGG